MGQYYNVDQNINHENGILKSLNYEDIEYIYKNKLCFPCLLNVNANGELESNLNCLKKISKYDINFKIENQREELELKCDINNNIKSENTYSKSILIPEIFCEFLFNNELNKISEETFFSTYQITKFKLLSININKENLSFNDNINKEFNEISNSYDSDEEKAKKIENIFRETGFRIPLKIYLGGSYIYKYEKSKFSEIINGKDNFEIKLNNIKLTGKEDFKNEKHYDFENRNSYKNVKIIGGDSLIYDKEQWIKTINLENSNVIEYSNIINTENILSLELRNKLRRPLQMIAEKYNKRFSYLKTVNELKKNKIKLLNISKYTDFETGNTKENNHDPHIYLKQFHVSVEASLIDMYTTYNLNENFKDIIVGLKIIGNRKDNDYNGEWTIMNNPILSHDLKIKFESRFVRKINYIIKVYLMETPK